MTVFSPRLPRVLAVLSFCFAALVSFAAESEPKAKPAPLPSEEACAAFGQKLAELLDGGQAAEVTAQLDKAALIARITPGLGFTATESRDFSAGLLNTLPASMQRQFESFSSAKFLRVQTVGGDRRALLRLVSSEGGASYLAFICAERGAGKLVWVDVFNYTSGESVSQATRRTTLPLIAESKKNALQQLISSESAFVTNFPAVMQATRLFQSSKIPESWAVTEKLPPEVRKDRTVLMLRLQLAQSLDDEKYLAVIKDWQAAFPNDATLDFISIDGDILRKDYAGAVKHVDSFAKRIGGDPYLDALAANVLFMAERYDEARKRARAALAAEPSLTDAFEALLNISLKTKNYAETVSLFEELHAQLPGLNLEEIAASDDYADFRLSRAYRDWSAKAKQP
jgi:tetratricopeptide (TPR) repeat protein